MPKTSLNPPGSQGGQQPNATISDAVEYVSSNPSGVSYVVNAVKWLVGLVGAFLKPGIKKP